MMMNLQQLILITVYLSVSEFAHGSGLTTCERDYVKIGCYEEYNAKSHDLLINDRYNIRWKTIEAYMHHLACICSKAAQDANKLRPKSEAYVGFALHYFGECYGRTKSHVDALTGKGQSHRCIGDQTYTTCDEKHKECVGHEYAEYIYKFRDLTGTIDVEGGYSNWEQWSKCEGKCGKGVKRRERTCTNPEPKGEGKDCSSLGKSTETAECDTGKKCPALLSEEFNQTACEGESVSISCKGDATIKIIDAVYGRLSLEVCQRWYENNWSTSCRAKTSLAKVKKACEGKFSCYVLANTGVFGEPCFGTEKYLQVKYRCKSRSLSL